MDINIRLARPADVSDMAEIHARSWKAAYKDILPMAYIEEKNATRPALFQRIITEDNGSQYIICYRQSPRSRQMQYDIMGI